MSKPKKAREISRDSAVRGRSEQVPTDYSCPNCGAVLGAEHLEETWIEVPIPGGWVLAYRLVRKGRKLVVAEGRVLPDEQGMDANVTLLAAFEIGDESRGEVGLVLPEDRGRPAGVWSGDSSSVPATGIPASVLRELRLTDPQAVLAAVRENLIARYGKKKAEEVMRGLWGDVRLTLPLNTASTGHPKLSNRELAKFSEDYIALAKSNPSKAIVLLAEKYHLSPNGARSRRRTAIARGILTKGDASSGKAGGSLTAKGKKARAPSSGRPVSKP